MRGMNGNNNRGRFNQTINYARNAGRQIGRNIVNYSQNAAAYVGRSAAQFGGGVRAGWQGSSTQPTAGTRFESAGYFVGSTAKEWLDAGKQFVVKTIPKAATWIKQGVIQYAGYAWRAVKQAGYWVINKLRRVPDIARRAARVAVTQVKKGVNVVRNSVHGINTKVARAITTPVSKYTATGRVRSQKGMQRAMNRYEQKVARRAALLGKAELAGGAYITGKLIYNQLAKEMEGNQDD